MDLNVLVTRALGKAIHEGTKTLSARQSAGTAAAGSGRELQQSSASAVLSTLVPAAIYGGIFFLAFLILRRIFPRIYRPRTYVSTLPPQERSPQPPAGLVNWIAAYFNVSDTVVLNTQETLDGFLFLRLLRIAVVTCLVGVIITWPILLPVNATGAAGQKQLNILTWSNVASLDQPNSYNRYYAHVVCAWLYFSFVIYMITRESIYYIALRQAYLVSPLYANRVSSRTVLFMSVPQKYLKEEVLRELLGKDQVKNVWIPTDTDDLEDRLDERDDMLMKLEGAEVDLIQAANKKRNEQLKKGHDIPLTEHSSNDHNDESGSVAARWVKAKDRPTHRTGFWGLWGEKVDTIDWCRKHLPAKMDEVDKLQAKHRAFEGKTRNSAFVQFHTLQDAQSAYQSLTHHLPLHMAPRHIGMAPDEILWYNLRTRWWERIIRQVAAIGGSVALVVFWTIPISFVGSISKIGYLASLPGLGWLDFVNKLGPVSGVVTGLLPVILLSSLMALLPIVLRLLARLAGDPTRSSVEYTVQNTYFWFYTIQGFLILTLSGSAFQAASQIFNNPASTVSLLANSLPEASNFFLSYFIIQGLGVVSNVLLSLVTLVVFLLFGKLLDSTPRKKFKRFVDLVNPQMGTYYPVYTTFFVIAISYACIAPLVLGFATIGLFLFYLGFRYNFIYVWQVDCDTKGLMYARALQQLFVGVYLAEFCMIGLFAIKLADSTKLLGPLILMIIFTIFTVLYNISLNAALRPLLEYLPKTLETEERRLLAAEYEESDVENEAADVPPTPPPKSGSMSTEGKEGRSTTPGSPASADAEKALTQLPPKQKQPNFFVKWLKPYKYADYYTLRRLVPREAFDIHYDEETERNAYFHPSVTKESDLLWIPRDDAGVSRQEVRHTSKVTPITDEGATLDEKGNIVWNQDAAEKAPIYQQRVYW